MTMAEAERQAYLALSEPDKMRARLTALAQVWDVSGQELLRVFEQQTGEVAIGVTMEHATLRVGRVCCDSGRFKTEGVRPHRMTEVVEHELAQIVHRRGRDSRRL